MGKFQIEDGILVKCNSNENSIVVPEGITTIGENAFNNLKKVKQLHLPSSLKKICRGAFGFCESLEEINLPDKIRSIGSFAFSGCKSLKQIELPENLQTIPEGLFDFCENLAIIKMPSKLKKISRWAFHRCHITEIHISSLSNWCGVNMDFRDSFDWNLSDLPRKLTLPKLYVNNALQDEIIIPLDVTEIKQGVFHQLDIKKVTITDNVCEIGEKAFSECENLEEITFANILPLKIGSYAFTKCNKLHTIVTPGEISVIEDHAFCLCKNLTSADIRSCNEIKDHAFRGCEKLREVHLCDEIVYVGKSAFENCELLEKINFPKNTRKIETETFKGCSNLSNITISNKLCEIGDSAFWGCTSLVSLMVGKNISSIEPYAFFICSNLVLRVHIGSYAAQYAKNNNIMHEEI